MASTNVGSGDGSLVMNTSASGNLSFDVVLSPARAAASPRAVKSFQSPALANSPRSLEDIAAKLKTAEGNRERLIDEKLEKIKEHEKRVEEVRKMQQEEAQKSQKLTLEMSQRKLAVAEELRQQRLESLVEKLKEHDSRIEQVRKSLAGKEESNGTDLQQQLDDATASRQMIAECIKEKQENGNAKENTIP